MASVVVPGRGPSGLDKLAKGLQIAGSVYGIVQANKKLEILDKQAAANEAGAPLRQQTAEANLEKTQLQIADTREQQKQRAAASQGILNPAQVAGGRFGVPVDAKQEGAQEFQLTSGGSTFLLPTEQFKAQEKSKLDESKLQMAQHNQALKEAKTQEQKTKLVKDGARKLGTLVQKAGFAEVMTPLEKIDKMISIDGEDDIPGIGATGALPDKLISQEGLEVRKSLAGLRNNLLKARSGGAVTPQEGDRLLEELGAGAFSSDRELRIGLQNLRAALKRNLGLLEATADAEVLAEYRGRPTSITSESAAFGGFAAPEAVADVGLSDIEAELARRNQEPAAATVGN